MLSRRTRLVSQPTLECVSDLLPCLAQRGRVLIPWQEAVEVMRRVSNVDGYQRVAQIMCDACGEPRVGLAIDKEDFRAVREIKVTGDPVLVQLQA